MVRLRSYIFVFVSS